MILNTIIIVIFIKILLNYFDVILRFFENSATAVKSTSVDELRAVSQESCITPTINPTPTTCIAMSFGIPNKLHARGTNNNEPPATPDAPHALTADNKLSNNAIPISTLMPKV